MSDTTLQELLDAQQKLQIGSYLNEIARKVRK